MMSAWWQSTYKRQDTPMKLKSMFFILFGFNIFLLSLLILCTFLLFDTQSELAKSQEIRYKSYKVADELRQSSDDLTRFARTYVITGNKMYEDFFWEILAIRNGEKPRPENYERIYWDLVLDPKIRPRPYSENKPLRSMMMELGFTEEEFQKLKQAQQTQNFKQKKIIKICNETFYSSLHSQ